MQNLKINGRKQTHQFLDLEWLNVFVEHRDTTSNIHSLNRNTVEDTYPADESNDALQT